MMNYSRIAVVLILFELLFVDCTSRNAGVSKFQVTYLKPISLNESYGPDVLDYANRRYRPIWSCTYCDDTLMDLLQFGPEGAYSIGIDELRKDSMLIAYWNLQLNRRIRVIGNRLLDNEDTIDATRRSDSFFYQCGDSLMMYKVLALDAASRTE